MLSIKVANWMVRVRIRSAALACDFLKCSKYSTSKAHAGSLFRGALHKKSLHMGFSVQPQCSLCLCGVFLLGIHQPQRHREHRGCTEKRAFVTLSRLLSSQAFSYAVDRRIQPQGRRRSGAGSRRHECARLRCLSYAQNADC